MTNETETNWAPIHLSLSSNLYNIYRTSNANVLLMCTVHTIHKIIKKNIRNSSIKSQNKNKSIRKCVFMPFRQNDKQMNDSGAQTQFNAWMDQMVLNIENVFVVFVLFATIKSAWHMWICTHMHKQRSMGYKKKKQPEKPDRNTRLGWMYLEKMAEQLKFRRYILCDVLQLSEKKMNKQWANHSILKRNHHRNHFWWKMPIYDKNAFCKETHSAHSAQRTERSGKKSIKIEIGARNNKIQQP